MTSERGKAVIRRKLLDWFVEAARDLPWRRTRDPYRIWLSEIMLQQTRVDQARPYYERFVSRYPNVHALAEANLDQVLKDWEGLGYYARARNLHRAAQMMVREDQGRFPTERTRLLALPGVGVYTANAVLSIAHNLPLAVVDGNVARVLSRLFETDADTKSTGGRRQLQALADDLIDPSRPGMFNEAMMELGATICTPATPECARCPIERECGARRNGTTEQYPNRRAKQDVPVYKVAVAAIFDEQRRLFIQRRPDDGHLGGLWELPGGKIRDGESERGACLREVMEEVGVTVTAEDQLPAVRHAYSHFKVIITPFTCSLSERKPAQDEESRWVQRDHIGRFAMPTATRKILRQLGWNE